MFSILLLLFKRLIVCPDAGSVHSSSLPSTQVTVSETFTIKITRLMGVSLATSLTMPGTKWAKRKKKTFWKAELLLWGLFLPGCLFLL